MKLVSRFIYKCVRRHHVATLRIRALSVCRKTAQDHVYKLIDANGYEFEQDIYDVFCCLRILENMCDKAMSKIVKEKKRIIV